MPDKTPVPGLPKLPFPRRSLRAGAGHAFVFLAALACLPPVAAVAAPGASRNPISFYYLRTVKCPADPSRPLEMVNGETSRFRDKRTGKTFRDGAGVMAEFARLARRGKTARAGAAPYAVPAEFRGAAGQATVYLTAVQRREVQGLRDELRSWRGLLAASPRVLSAADMEPNAVADVNTATKKVFLSLTLTKTGTKKIAEFTGKHKKEVLAMVLDPERPGSRLLMAPTVMAAITSPGLEISGGFTSLAEAKTVSDRINTR